MSVVTITEAWPAAGRPFTVAELDRMPDDGRRYELLDGALVVSPQEEIRLRAIRRPVVLDREPRPAPAGANPLRAARRTLCSRGGDLRVVRGRPSVRRDGCPGRPDPRTAPLKGRERVSSAGPPCQTVPAGSACGRAVPATHRTAA